MASFFEKLKKGMGTEEPIEEPVEEPLEETTAEKPIRKRRKKLVSDHSGESEAKSQVEKAKVKNSVKKIEIKTAQIEPEPEEITPEPEEEKEIPETPEEEIPTPETSSVEESEEKWFEPEGQLAIDVYQTDKDLVIQSAIAGVKPGNLDITMEKDILTIKGSREKPYKESSDYFSQECFWGVFSREIILPAEVDPNRVKAEIRDGVLTIRIPKTLREKKRKIVVTS